MSNDPTEFDRFAEVAKETLEGIELDRVLTEIDHAAQRRARYSREPVWSEHGEWVQNDLALLLYRMRVMVAEHDGTPPPPDPLASRRENMERRAELKEAFVAKREARQQREREEAMRTPIQPPVERPLAVARPSKSKKAVEPPFIDPRQMSLF